MKHTISAYCRSCRLSVSVESASKSKTNKAFRFVTQTPCSKWRDPERGHDWS